MPVDIAIKGVPDALASELRRRAAQHNRSPEEEAAAILEANLTPHRPQTLADLLAKVQRRGLHTPSESVAILRDDRDAPGRH